MRLVLLPGLDGTGLLFEPFIHTLPPWISPLVISYPPDQVLSYADLLRYLRVHIPTDENFVLLAESFSGPLAIEFAVLAPETLKAIILCASFISNPTIISRNLSFLISTGFFRIDPPQFLVEKYLLGADPPASLIDVFYRAVRSVSSEVMAGRVREVLHVDARGSLRDCRLPVLYLVAKNDRVVKDRSLAEMRAINLRMEVASMEGPHFLLQREPKACMEPIEQFIRRVV